MHKINGTCLVIMAMVGGCAGDRGCEGGGGGRGGGGEEQLALGKDGQEEVIVQVDGVESKEVPGAGVKLLLGHLQTHNTLNHWKHIKKLSLNT